MMILLFRYKSCHEFINVNEYLGECQDVTLTVTDVLGCSNNKHRLFYILFLK